MIDGLGKLLRTGLVGVRASFRCSPGWFLLALVLTLLQAAFPAMQFFLMRRLVEAAGAQVEDMAPVLVAIAVLVGLVYPLAQIATAASQRMALRVRADYRARLINRAAALEPQDLATQEVATALEAADQAIAAIHDVGPKALQLMGAVGASFFLTGALWSVDVVAGLLVAAAVLPAIVAFSLVARRESAGWPKVAASERRGRYLMEQLLQQRTATELSTMGGGWLVAARGQAKIRQAAQVLDGMVGYAMRMELIAAGATAVLFGGVIIRVVLVSGSAASAAAAVVAVIVGMNSIRQCGYAAGGLISASPRLESFEKIAGAMGGADDASSGPISGARAAVSCLRVDGVGLRYPGAESLAIQGIDMTLRRGELVALVGVNGRREIDNR